MISSAGSLRQLAVTRPSQARLELTELATALRARNDSRADGVAALATSVNLVDALDAKSALLEPLLRGLAPQKGDPHANAQVAHTRSATLGWGATAAVPPEVELYRTGTGAAHRFLEFSFLGDAGKVDLPTLRRAAALGDLTGQAASLERLVKSVNPTLGEKAAEVSRELRGIHGDLQQLLAQTEAGGATDAGPKRAAALDAGRQAVEALLGFAASKPGAVYPKAMEFLSDSKAMLQGNEASKGQLDRLQAVREEVARFATPEALRTLGAPDGTLRAVRAFLEAPRPAGAPTADLTSLQRRMAAADSLFLEVDRGVHQSLGLSPARKYQASLEGMAMTAGEAKAHVEGGRWTEASLALGELYTSVSVAQRLVSGALGKSDRAALAADTLKGAGMAADGAKQQLLAGKLEREPLRVAVAQVVKLLDQVPRV